MDDEPAAELPLGTSLGEVAAINLYKMGWTFSASPDAGGFTVRATKVGLQVVASGISLEVAILEVERLIRHSKNG